MGTAHPLITRTGGAKPRLTSGGEAAATLMLGSESVLMLASESVRLFGSDYGLVVAIAHWTTHSMTQAVQAFTTAHD